MLKLSHYNQEFILKDPFGNNAFDYEKRSESHPEPYIRIAPLLSYPNAATALQKFQIGLTPAFEIYDEEKLRSMPGLINFLEFPAPSSGRPVFVFDNHNHAFYFWHATAQQLKIPEPLLLIHIDQHKDSRIPATFLSAEDSKNPQLLFEYTNLTLNVGNFIPPAIKTGLLSDAITIDSEASIKAFKEPSQPFILDIDLDFFAPELDYIGNQNKLDLIRQLLPKAAMTTIATSPYFIDQELAQKYLDAIFSPA